MAPRVLRPAVSRLSALRISVEAESLDMLQLKALIRTNAKRGEALFFFTTLNFMLQWNSRTRSLLELEIGVKPIYSNKDILSFVFLLGKLLNKIMVDLYIVLLVWNCFIRIILFDGIREGETIAEK